MVESIALLTIAATQAFILQRVVELDSRLDNLSERFTRFIVNMPKRRDDL